VPIFGPSPSKDECGSFVFGVCGATLGSGIINEGCHTVAESPRCINSVVAVAPEATSSSFHFSRLSCQVPVVVRHLRRQLSGI
jgi:hypothetical protein